jgi:PAS domain S-box-containing protein
MPDQERPTAPPPIEAPAADPTAERADEVLAAMRLADEGLRLTLRYAAAGIWERNLASGALAWSPENFALFGVEPAETLDHGDWQRCVHPDDLDPTEAAMRDAVEGRTPEYHSEYRVLHPTLGTRWILGAGRVERGPAGEALRFRGLNLDITERKRGEQRLRESEALYRSLFTLAPSGVVLNDAEGRIVAFNDQTHQQLGYTREEFERLRLSDVDATEQPDEVRRHIAHIAATGGDEYEVLHRTKSGEIRNVLVRTRPVEIGGERLFVNVWQDITDRKRAEAALRESDRRKTEFLAVLSHELRNPLAPIRNGIHLLEHAAAGSDQARHATEVIRRQAEHLTRLVDDLLDVTRISRGKIELQRRNLDLREVASKAADDLRSSFEQSRVELRVEGPAGPVWVEADRTRVAQVVGNLLQNAMKFTPAGRTVTVSIAASGGCAELRVRDDGVGMEPTQVERMFEPFAQGDQTLARTHGGLGLGLALVKSLVELHGGSVQAHSDGVGRGSEFVVKLPLSRVGAVAGEERREDAGRAAGPGRVVLVIEDSVDAGQTLAEILELRGHRVSVAREGGEGLRLARTLRPDVVLCDIGLPDVDGYEIARAVRRDESLRSTRLIALSGYAQPEDLAMAIDAGFDAHLAKPATLDQLERLLA